MRKSIVLLIIIIAALTAALTIPALANNTTLPQLQETTSEEVITLAEKQGIRIFRNEEGEYRYSIMTELGVYTSVLFDPATTELIVTTGGETATGTNSRIDMNSLSFPDGGSLNITLRDCKLQPSGDTAPWTVYDFKPCNVNLTLEGDNLLTSPAGQNALTIAAGNIYTVGGTGSLTLNGTADTALAIGGVNGNTGGNLLVKTGTITAQGTINLSGIVNQGGTLNGFEGHTIHDGACTCPYSISMENQTKIIPSGSRAISYAVPVESFTQVLENACAASNFGFHGYSSPAVTMVDLETGEPVQPDAITHTYAVKSGIYEVTIRVITDEEPAKTIFSNYLLSVLGYGEIYLLEDQWLNICYADPGRYYYEIKDAAGTIHTQDFIPATDNLTISTGGIELANGSSTINFRSDLGNTELNITLDNLWLRKDSAASDSVWNDNSTGNKNLTLVGMSSLVAGSQRSSLRIRPGAKYTIDGDGTLVLNGDIAAADHTSQGGDLCIISGKVGASGTVDLNYIAAAPGTVEGAGFGTSEIDRYGCPYMADIVLEDQRLVVDSNGKALLTTDLDTLVLDCPIHGAAGHSFSSKVVRVTNKEDPDTLVDGNLGKYSLNPGEYNVTYSAEVFGVYGSSKTISSSFTVNVIRDIPILLGEHEFMNRLHINYSEEGGYSYSTQFITAPFNPAVDNLVITTKGAKLESTDTYIRIFPEVPEDTVLNIGLNNCHLKMTSTNNPNVWESGSDCNVNLTLMGNNTLEANRDRSALRIPVNAEYVIYGDGTLTLNGQRSLGFDSSVGGSLWIKSGKVIANANVDLGRIVAAEGTTGGTGFDGKEFSEELCSCMGDHVAINRYKMAERTDVARIEIQQSMITTGCSLLNAGKHSFRDMSFMVTLKDDPSQIVSPVYPDSNQYDLPPGEYVVYISATISGGIYDGKRTTVSRGYTVTEYGYVMLTENCGVLLEYYETGGFYQFQIKESDVRQFSTRFYPDTESVVISTGGLKQSSTYSSINILGWKWTTYNITLKDCNLSQTQKTTSSVINIDRTNSISLTLEGHNSLKSGSERSAMPIINSLHVYGDGVLTLDSDLAISYHGSTGGELWVYSGKVIADGKVDVKGIYATIGTLKGSGFEGKEITTLDCTCRETTVFEPQSLVTQEGGSVTYTANIDNSINALHAALKGTCGVLSGGRHELANPSITITTSAGRIVNPTTGDLGYSLSAGEYTVTISAQVPSGAGTRTVSGSYDLIVDSLSGTIITLGENQGLDICADSQGLYYQITTKGVAGEKIRFNQEDNLIITTNGVTQTSSYSSINLMESIPQGTVLNLTLASCILRGEADYRSRVWNAYSDCDVNLTLVGINHLRATSYAAALRIPPGATYTIYGPGSLSTMDSVVSISDNYSMGGILWVESGTITADGMVNLKAIVKGEGATLNGGSFNNQEFASTQCICQGASNADTQMVVVNTAAGMGTYKVNLDRMTEFLDACCPVYAAGRHEISNLSATIRNSSGVEMTPSSTNTYELPIGEYTVIYSADVPEGEGSRRVTLSDALVVLKGKKISLGTNDGVRIYCVGTEYRYQVIVNAHISGYTVFDPATDNLVITTDGVMRSGTHSYIGLLGYLPEDTVLNITLYKCMLDQNRTGGSPWGADSSCDVNLTLVGENVLKADPKRSALRIRPRATYTINGTGSLSTQDSVYAISNDEFTGGTLWVKSGTIIAEGIVDLSSIVSPADGLTGVGFDGKTIANTAPCSCLGVIQLENQWLYAGNNSSAPFTVSRELLKKNCYVHGIDAHSLTSFTATATSIADSAETITLTEGTPRNLPIGEYTVALSANTSDGQTVSGSFTLTVSNDHWIVLGVDQGVNIAAESDGLYYEVVSGGFTRDKVYFSQSENLVITTEKIEQSTPNSSINIKSSVSDDKTLNITLKDCVLRQDFDGYASVWNAESACDVNLTLVGTNSLKLGSSRSALRIPSGAKYAIGGDGALSTLDSALAISDNLTTGGELWVYSGKVTAEGTVDLSNVYAASGTLEGAGFSGLSGTLPECTCGDGDIELDRLTVVVNSHVGGVYTADPEMLGTALKSTCSQFALGLHTITTPTVSVASADNPTVALSPDGGNPLQYTLSVGEYIVTITASVTVGETGGKTVKGTAALSVADGRLISLGVYQGVEIFYSESEGYYYVINTGGVTGEKHTFELADNLIITTNGNEWGSSYSSVNFNSSIPADATLNITLNNCKLNQNSSWGDSVWNVNSDCNVNLTLMGVNKLGSGSGRRSLVIPGGSVYTVRGSGSLEAARIGAFSGTGGILVMESGTINASETVDLKSIFHLGGTLEGDGFSNEGYITDLDCTCPTTLNMETQYFGIDATTGRATYTATVDQLRGYLEAACQEFALGRHELSNLSASITDSDGENVTAVSGTPNTFELSEGEYTVTLRVNVPLGEVDKEVEGSFTAKVSRSAIKLGKDQGVEIFYSEEEGYYYIISTAGKAGDKIAFELTDDLIISTDGEQTSSYSSVNFSSTIPADATLNIVLNNCRLSQSETYSSVWNVNSDCNVNLILMGVNKLGSGSSRRSLVIPGESIYTVSGSGSLEAARIGTNSGTGGILIMRSGKITGASNVNLKRIINLGGTLEGSGFSGAGIIETLDCVCTGTQTVESHTLLVTEGGSITYTPGFDPLINAFKDTCIAAMLDLHEFTNQTVEIVNNNDSANPLTPTTEPNGYTLTQGTYTVTLKADTGNEPVSASYTLFVTAATPTPLEPNGEAHYITATQSETGSYYAVYSATLEPNTTYYVYKYISAVNVSVYSQWPMTDEAAVTVNNGEFTTSSATTYYFYLTAGSNFTHGSYASTIWVLKYYNNMTAKPITVDDGYTEAVNLGEPDDTLFAMPTSDYGRGQSYGRLYVAQLTEGQTYRITCADRNTCLWVAYDSIPSFANNMRSYQNNNDYDGNGEQFIFTPENTGNYYILIACTNKEGAGPVTFSVAQTVNVEAPTAAQNLYLMNLNGKTYHCYSATPPQTTSENGWTPGSALSSDKVLNCNLVLIPGKQAFNLWLNLDLGTGKLVVMGNDPVKAELNGSLTINGTENCELLEIEGNLALTIKGNSNIGGVYVSNIGGDLTVEKDAVASFAYIRIDPQGDVINNGVINAGIEAGTITQAALDNVQRQGLQVYGDDYYSNILNNMANNGTMNLREFHLYYADANNGGIMNVESLKIDYGSVLNNTGTITAGRQMSLWKDSTINNYGTLENQGILFALTSCEVTNDDASGAVLKGGAAGETGKLIWYGEDNDSALTNLLRLGHPVTTGEKEVHLVSDLAEDGKLNIELAIEYSPDDYDNGKYPEYVQLMVAMYHNGQMLSVQTVPGIYAESMGMCVAAELSYPSGLEGETVEIRAYMFEDETSSYEPLLKEAFTTTVTLTNSTTP